MTTSVTMTTTSTITQERPQYPIGVPSKFSPDGIVQRYPGNTTVCHISADSPLQPGMRAFYNAFRSRPEFAESAHLLPPSSWHMTVLDGVRETECEPGMWPSGMEKQPLPQCTVHFAQRLRQLGLELEQEGLAPPYRMRVRSFDTIEVGIGLVVEGATAEEEKRLRRLRDKLADALGFRAPNHETYRFHVTMAYMLRHADGKRKEEIESVIAEHLPALQREFDLGSVEFCTFENMYSFPRLFYLGEKEERY